MAAGADEAAAVDVCLTALPNSHELTIDAKRRVQSDSCTDEGSGAKLAMTSAFPSPDKHGCNKNVSFEL